MREMRLARFSVVLVFVPVCALCLLGPTVIASIFAGVTAWFGVLDMMVMAALALVANVAVSVIVGERSEKHSTTKPAEEAHP